VVEASITEAVDRFTLKKVSLKIICPDEPIYITADKEKLKIAFLNIMINAVEAMNKNKGELLIEIKKATHPIVTISDNGSGISEENLSELFEPYFTSKKKGLGLGLTTTLNILQSHRAGIEVHSRLNKGTTFTISFFAS
jgi:two-component system, sporulation sensor kinase E